MFNFIYHFKNLDNDEHSNNDEYSEKNFENRIDFQMDTYIESIKVKPKRFNINKTAKINKKDLK